MKTTEEYTCTVCGSNEIYEFVQIEQVPVYCNVLLRTYEDALGAKRGDLRLGFCQKCGHIFNIAFDASLIEYTQDYENSLHFSPRFSDYAMSLARYLVDRYELRNKTVIEIGCGKGEFLRLFPQLGVNRAIGFDPSYEPERDGSGESENVSFIRDYYSEKYNSYKADLICCRHVLEHVQSPRVFLEGIRKSISNNNSAVVFFEVPNAFFTFRDAGIWDIIYEHCSYFSRASLLRLLNLSGFKVTELREAFDGQYLCIEARPNGGENGCNHGQVRSVREMESHVLSFEGKYSRELGKWERDLEDMRRKSKRVVIWGGGSKGVTFSNILRAQDFINYIVDINPHKHWKFVPGTGQKIVPQGFLQDYKPHIIIVMNSVYLDEINHMTRKIRSNAEFLSA